MLSPEYHESIQPLSLAILCCCAGPPGPRARFPRNGTSSVNVYWSCARSPERAIGNSVLHLADVQAPRMGTSTREDEVRTAPTSVSANIAHACIPCPHPSACSVPCAVTCMAKCIGLGVRITRVPPRAGRWQNCHLHVHALAPAFGRCPARHRHCRYQRRGPGIRAPQERMGETQGAEARFHRRGPPQEGARG